MKRLGIFTILCLALTSSLAALPGAESSAALDQANVAAADAVAVDAAEVSTPQACAGSFSSPPNFVAITDGADRGGNSRSSCTASATCYNGSTISCSGTTSCTAQDANCPTSRGYVNCGSGTQYCPACPGSGPCPVNSCGYTFNKFTYCCVSPTCMQICW